MQNVLKAIQETWNESTGLTARFPRGLYLAVAPVDTPLPLAILTIVSETPSYQCGDPLCYERLDIQFAVYTATLDEAETAKAEIRKAFDFVDLDDCEECRRLQQRTEYVQEDNYWQGIIEYRISFERTIGE